MEKNLEKLLSGDYVEMKEVEVLNNFPNTHGIKFTQKDLEDFAEDTNEVIKKGWMKPNIKISHSDQQLLLREMFGMKDAEIYEEIPNLGLVDNFKFKKDNKGLKIVADFKQVPKIMKDFVFSGKLFTSLSPELVKNWRNTGKKVIRAIALSNIPSMKHVLDVPMSQGLNYVGYFNIENDGGLDMGDSNDTNLTQESVETLLDDKLQKNNESLLTKFSESVKDLFTKKSSTNTPTVRTTEEGNEQMVSLSEVQAMQNEMTLKFTEEVNKLKLQLVEKDKGVTQLSEDVKKQKLESKQAQAKAICKEAQMDGVPPVVISLFKPILMSEIGEQTIKMSEVITDNQGKQETVEVEKPVATFVEELFRIYPSKVNMSEVSKTFLSSTSADEDKKINERMKELMAEGKPKHEALMIAGSEFRGK